MSKNEYLMGNDHKETYMEEKKMLQKLALYSLFLWKMTRLTYQEILRETQIDNETTLLRVVLGKADLKEAVDTVDQLVKLLDLQTKFLPTPFRYFRIRREVKLWRNWKAFLQNRFVNSSI